MKLQSACWKANFKMFNKKYKHIELETFPKKAKEAVHCLGYQDDINELLDKSLDNLKEEEQKEYLTMYGKNMEDAVYNIQIRTGNLNLMVMGVHTETKAMAIYTRKSHAKLSYNLMEFIAPTLLDLLKSNIKFISVHMPYDKSLPNEAFKYDDLLCEQNLYLERYDDFKIGGLHKTALDYKMDDGTTIRSTLLSADSIVDIHSTVYTDQKGIWIIETTKKNIAAAIKWMEEFF
eukprot:8146523-Ditylum_brightwellii.AAC.1